TLKIQRKERGDPSASVSITLHCKEELFLQRRIEWLSRAGSSAARVKQQQPLVSAESDLAELANLIATAPDATTQAFARHLRAQTLLLGGHSSDAAVAFADAEAAWIKLGDLERGR